MDGFTAGLLLSAVQRNPKDVDRIIDFGKGLKGPGPTEDNIARAEAMKGRKCSIKDTCHTGATVLGANTAKGGFADGGRYPVLVRIDTSGIEGAVGQVFEYGFDQVELIEE